ncbi:glycosyltransferase [bacterium AH-315-F18]|nr:glycosyltransferase [bacterium AH-315-F18]
MSREKPRLSVVTPTFNGAEFIEDAIHSVLDQKYSDLEYIIVDGGNDTETPDIVRRFGDRVKYIREPDGGQSDAINKGFAAATGDVLAWMNADDYYVPGAVAKAMARFEADPQLDVFYGDAIFTDRQGQFLRYFSEVEPFNVHRVVSCSNYICQPTTFFKRSAFEKVGPLDTDLNFVMDWDLWSRFALAGCRFHYEAEPIAINREFGTTKTRTGGVGTHRRDVEAPPSACGAERASWTVEFLALGDRQGFRRGRTGAALHRSFGGRPETTETSHGRSGAGAATLRPSAP